MKVFLTGATGFIGSAILPELIGAGHRVLALARSDDAAKKVAAAGAEVQLGSLDDVESLKKAAASCDGVIHCAYIHDFSQIAVSGEKDVAAIEALGEALAKSEKPFVVTSALGMMPSGRLVTEADVPDPTSAGKHRIEGEKAALALASRGIRVSALRLPYSVHGDGDYAFVPGLIKVAREKGLSAYIGEGLNRWPAVHRLDVAVLYRLALEKAAPGAVLHGVGEEAISTRAIAEAIGRGLKVPVASKSPEEAAAHFTWLAKFFAADTPTSSARTREQLGWTPRQPSLIEDLDKGTYFA